LLTIITFAGLCGEENKISVNSQQRPPIPRFLVCQAWGEWVLFLKGAAGSAYDGAMGRRCV
jgi:hypothetical protein